MNASSFLHQIRLGASKAAFRYLYGALPSFKRWVHKNGGSADDANDLFQDALIIVYKKCEEPTFQLTVDPKTYALSVAKYLYKNHQRKFHNHELSIDDIEENTQLLEIDEFVDKEDQYRKAQTALRSIGEKCIELLNQYYYLKLNMQEIALNLEFRNAEVAKAMKYKCLEKARNIIAPKITTNEIAGKN